MFEVHRGGFEPPTSRLSVGCSTRLSYQCELLQKFDQKPMWGFLEIPDNSPSARLYATQIRSNNAFKAHPLAGDSSPLRASFF